MRLDFYKYLPICVFFFFFFRKLRKVLAFSVTRFPNHFLLIFQLNLSGRKLSMLNVCLYRLFFGYVSCKNSSVVLENNIETRGIHCVPISNLFR